MLASYLLDATRPGHPLEDTSLEHLSYKALTEEDVCGRGAKAVPFAQLAPGTLLTYACDEQVRAVVDRAIAALRDRSARRGRTRGRPASIRTRSAS